MRVCLLSVIFSGLSACAIFAQAEPVLTPPSFSAAFEDALATQEWERAYATIKPQWVLPDGTTLPLDLRIRDLDTGESATLKPGVIYSVAERQRWGGQSLDVDWVLVLDTATDIVHRTTLSIQLKSTRPRTLQLEVGPRVEATNGALRIARTLTETSDTIPTRLGAQGERAQHTFGILEAPPLALLIGVNPTEPRLYQITTRPEESFVGIRFEVALSPKTEAFPGRAAFQCTFAAWPTGAGTYALEHATEIWRQLWPDPTNTAHASATTKDTAPFATTRYPLVFSPRIRTAQTLNSKSAWTLYALDDARPDPLATLEQSLTDPTLEELENFARDARVRITTDSTAPGFNPEALADGVRGMTTNTAAADGWRSDASATNHFIHLDFPHPTSFAGLNIAWPFINGQPQTSRALTISGISANDAPIPIAQLDDIEATPSTTIPLPSIALKRLTLQMPQGAGSATHPNQFCVSELELR